MKSIRRIISIAMLLCICLNVDAGKPNLKFNGEGEFKIVQLTDLHLNIDHPAEAVKTLARVQNIISSEHPDFIAITGDVLYGGNPSLDLLGKLLECLETNGVDYAIVYGNHDREGHRDAVEMSRMIASGAHSHNVLNADGLLADVCISVSPTRDRKASPLDIYMFDSHDYASNDGYAQVGGYSWLSRAQIDWYTAQCLEANKANGGRNVPSVSFFHIPFPEFLDAWLEAESTKHNSVIGLRGEYGGHPRVNSGMFTAMLESGNMMGVFCGHDHDSNYIVGYRGIALVYGCFSGDDTVYNHLAHSTRVVVVREGERCFRTWNHDDDGRIVYDAEYKDGKVTNFKK